MYLSYFIIYLISHTPNKCIEVGVDSKCVYVYAFESRWLR